MTTWLIEQKVMMAGGEQWVRCRPDPASGIPFRFGNRETAEWALPHVMRQQGVTYIPMFRIVADHEPFIARQ